MGFVWWAGVPGCEDRLRYRMVIDSRCCADELRQARELERRELVT
jgi:hypothetical protein